MIGNVVAGRRVRTRALQSSGMVLALVLGGSAFAQCAPEPTVANGTTTCTGVDADGFTVTSNGTTVDVPAGATVLGGGQPAVAVRLPSDLYGGAVKVTVAGRVDGGTQAGVSLLWQPTTNGYAYGTANLDLQVAQGGTVTGTNAVVVGQAGSGYGSAYATVDNAGTLSGTGGVALLASAPGYGGFSSIINRATGTIGAISGPVGTLTNGGLIDGGANSAVDYGTGQSLCGNVTNSGTITAASTAATLANLAGGRTLSNDGAIENRGTGAALAGDGFTLNNTGRITSAGATAVTTSTFLSLTNTGTITGNVVTAASPQYSTGSTVDSSAGTIIGDLTFGTGDDTLAGYNGALVTGVSGAIDGGAGLDTVRIRFGADATLDGTPALPTGFERFTLAPDAGVTATLADGFAAPGPLQVGGAGMIINRTVLSGATQAVVESDYVSGGATTFINAGTIRTTAGVSGTPAVQVYSYHRFDNNGTIDATGTGVGFSSQGSFTNTGLITAAGTGVDLFGPSFTNGAGGVIRSTGGIGVALSGSSGSNWTNAGRIEGATVGASISSTLVNTGVITSAGTGVALQFYGFLDNRVGGTVTGAVAGVSAGTYASYNAGVANAGVINGDVDLAGQSGNYYPNNNIYFAQPGGVLNGNLTLGREDTLVTEIGAGVGAGAGQVAGITGTVTGTDSLLRLRVRADTSATLATPAGFVGVGYDLFDGAVLSLTGSAAESAGSNRPLVTLAGQGTVDLNATLSGSSQPLIGVGSVLSVPGETVPGDRALTVTSRGALSLDHANDSGYAYAAVALGATDSFTNAGTLFVRDRAQTVYTPINAISGGASVTNTGTITLDGTNGVTGAQVFTNTGAILQAAGGRAATGVNGVATLINSGTIDVGGTAVQVGYGGSLTNGGRIASSGGAAIGFGTYGSSYGTTITNLAGGTIAGGPIAGGGVQAIQIGGGTVSNAGTITGSVDLGYSFNGRSFSPATYVANGGTIAGDLRFGSGDDTLVAFDDVVGVSGTVDAGDGTDTFVHARATSGTVTLGTTNLLGFEREGVRAAGAGTVVTIAAPGTFATDVKLSGDGSIVNTATLGGAVLTDFDYYAQPRLASFSNTGSIANGFSGSTGSFANSGTIGTATLATRAVTISNNGALAFDNSGRIVTDGSDVAVSLYGAQAGAVSATNSGTIVGGLTAASYGDGYYGGDSLANATASVAIGNTGTITTAGRTAVSLYVDATATAGGIATLANSGTIETTRQAGTGVSLYGFTQEDANGVVAPIAMSVINSGTIRADGGGVEVVQDTFGSIYRYLDLATGLSANGSAAGTATFTNTATGLIEATGTLSVAVASFGPALDLTNAGTIRGSAGTALSPDDALAVYLDRPFLAGAVLGTNGDDRVVNTGTITGSIDLGRGADRLDNRGRIDGAVFLGAGDDRFLQLAGATLNGGVDAGEGTDELVIDATGGGAVDGDGFVGFERLSQVGVGDLSYSGRFRFDTIGISGGSVTVAAGRTLSSDGAVTLTGGDTADTVFNNGTIAGAVSLGGGADRFTNNGAVGGAVSLGEGDDQFVEGAGSSVAGGVDGGAGNDLYTVVLAGDRAGLGARSGFERLVVTGTGTLSLALDQSFGSVALAGAGLNLALNGRTVGAVSGTDAAEALSVDGNIAAVALGGGDDRFATGATRLAGRYDGGAGLDTLGFTATAPVTLAGTATGFERVTLAGGALNVTGSLGTAGAALSFGAGDQRLTVADGGTLAGAVDLGAGDDTLRLAPTAIVNGTVAGGAGQDTVILDLAGARTLGAGLSGFELLTTQGAGTLSLGGAQAFDRVAASGDLTVLAGASLVAPVAFGAADNRFTVAGRFAGSVDGGAGTDTIAVAGGSEDAPVAFGDVANVEALTMTGGFATVSGTAALGGVDLTGGRLVGLAGSTIGARTILVRSGATFGSAGTVNGDLTVAGTLSPGATQGTMTVNGNVALQAGSVSLFEITPGVSDKLLVNGAASIATGATLRLVASGALRPGASYDLLVASGGITGGFTTVVKPDNLFGFVVQRADRIQLLGQFGGDPAFSPQVARSVAYANATLALQPATSSLFAALPSLLTANGASDPAGFARLTPEPYASAVQMGVDDALVLTEAARGPAFATTGDEAHLYTFAQTLGGWHRLSADADTGTAAARNQLYGFLGGIGVGGAAWSVGGFAGYLNDRQRIETLGARTTLDGVVAGVSGRFRTTRGFGVTASAIYDGGKARTNRALPGAAGANGRYDLHSIAADLKVSYDVAVGSDWTLSPHAGVTYARTTRDGVTEGGGSPFALTVARDRHTAGFVDGGLSFGRAETSAAPFRPFVSLGARGQVQGMRTSAVAGYAGGGLGLTALGAARSRVVGTAAGGVAYRLPSGLDLFASVASRTGRDDHGESATAGVRLRF